MKKSSTSVLLKLTAGAIDDLRVRVGCHSMNPLYQSFVDDFARCLSCGIFGSLLANAYSYTNLMKSFLGST